MPKSYFDPSTGRYELVGEGPVSLERLMAIELSSLSGSKGATDNLAALVANKSITASQWQALMREEIKQEYIRQYILGRGGLSAMTQADWGRIGAMVREQYRYLRGFAAEVAAGNLTETQIAWRAEMYSNSAKEAFEKARGMVMRKAGFDQEKWALGIAEHCKDCEDFASQGWKPIGYFPFPGEGKTRCLTKCRCTKLYYNSVTGFEDTLMDYA
jgi:hypothetical protein